MTYKAKTMYYAIVMNEKHEKELDQIVMELVTSGWPTHPIKEKADLDSRKSLKDHSSKIKCHRREMWEN